MTLPRSLDDLQGLRAARWIRESTSGQFDAFGPDAQREQQDRAIERSGLVDTGLAWQVAHSGRTVGSTPQFAEMMAAAGRDFDVLVVGYVSRFARDARTAWNARHDLHDRGAVILFADERILTSDEDAWDSWAREAVEAESYSRKLARRIREGYAAKRRRLGEPGGRPPFGFVRRGRPPRLEPGEELVRVRSAYGLAASGHVDHDIASAIELPIDTVRGILTNPIYAGHLRDGSAAAVEPVVDVATWAEVQRRRRARHTRGGKPATHRVYALPMLRCAACGTRLTGDTGRYRHRKPCPAFTAARRRRAWKNQLVKSLGTSYAQGFYEDAIAAALQEWSLDPRHLTEAATIDAAKKPDVDQLALRRIDAERDRALTRYSRDRDVAVLEATMTRLDAEDQSVRTSGHPDNIAPWSEVLPWLLNLARLWRESEPAMRKRIAEQLFVHVDALGCRELIVTPTTAAAALVGAQTVTVVGARGFNPVVVRVRTPIRLRPLEARSA